MSTLSLGAVYGRVARWRRSWYEQRPQARRRLSRPVVSVGNLAVGGSGKTPVVAAVARLLIDLGYTPAVLSRGYGRRGGAAVTVVSDRERVRATVDESGDEPAMLARQLPGVPVVVAADRYRAGRVAEESLGATCHVLDDGFQHLRLARQVDLILVSPVDLADRPFPGGRLREPLDAARAADAVLVPGSGDEAARVGAAVAARATFAVSSHYGTLRWTSGAGRAVPDGRRVHAVAAIARPGRFADALRACGFEVVGTTWFRDHHWFTDDDVARVGRAARERGADLIVTTEKDAVRLRSDVPWAVLPMTATIEPGDRFTTWLRDRL